KHPFPLAKVLKGKTLYMVHREMEKMEVTQSRRAAYEQRVPSSTISLYTDNVT
ncbi:hypothetical protein HMPREF9148_00417, partial [Prevotella sp. F0091]